jgi:RNA polymerase sigma factor (sigma-70 family)
VAVWVAADVDDLSARDGGDLVELLWRRGPCSFCLLCYGEPEHDGVAVDFCASHGDDRSVGDETAVPVEDLCAVAAKPGPVDLGVQKGSEQVEVAVTVGSFEVPGDIGHDSRADRGGLLGMVAGLLGGWLVRVLVAPYLRELHAHCYRMLGSVHDAEDVLQEVLMRAWRHLGGFDGRGSVRGWLYRIATNRCLTARARAAASPAPALSPPPPPPNAPEVEVTELEPYPDEWLRELAGRGDPAVGYEVRESVQLAFLTVIQLLPPRQRAVLLLRDVLGFSAAETAQILQAGPAAPAARWTSRTCCRWTSPGAR